MDVDIVVLGAKGSGKTSLIHKFVADSKPPVVSSSPSPKFSTGFSFSFFVYLFIVVVVVVLFGFICEFFFSWSEGGKIF